MYEHLIREIKNVNVKIIKFAVIIWKNYIIWRR